MLSRNSLIEVMERYFAAEKEYKERVKHEYLKPCISDGNNKIGNTLNFSLGFDGCFKSGAFKICALTCYATRDMVRRGDVVINARARNQVLADHDRDRMFAEIRKAIKARKKNFYFRWHVAGEIPDHEYFAEMVKIARENPHFVFWTYTKRYNIINDYCDKNGRDAIPDNFKIMFSAWEGLNMNNPYDFPRFEFIPKGTEEKNMPHKFTCPGNCDVCKKIIPVALPVKVQIAENTKKIQKGRRKNNENDR